MNLNKIIAKIKLSSIGLFGIILIGSFFRFYNLDWDQGYNFHPDENNIAVAVSRIRFFSQLNPHFFQYNGLSIYLYRATGDVLSWLTHNQNWVTNLSSINLIGRNYSALVASITIFLIYKLALKLTDNKIIALLTSLLVALNVSLIQSAHFAVTDSLLVFFLILLANISLSFTIKPTIKKLIIMGSISGMALATKTTALSFLIIPSVTILIIAFKKIGLDSLKKLVYMPIILIFFTLFLFCFFSPYSLINWPIFLAGMSSEKGIITGVTLVSWNYQFLHTMPYLFPVKNFFWQMGPAVLIFSILGFLYITFKIIRSFFYPAKSEQEIVLSTPIIIWSWVFFLTVGALFSKYVRYYNPLLPFFCLFSAFFLVNLYKKTKLIGLIIFLITIFSSLLYSLAFWSIYNKESTHITASRWILNNIPDHANILTEDEILPLSLRDFPSKPYNIFHLHPPLAYSSDDQSKQDLIINRLVQADYIVITSRRIYANMLKLAPEFPFMSKYYQLLFSGALGYQPIAEFSSYPTLFGFKINDDSAEETFQVFDHPKVLIFKNVAKENYFGLQKILKVVNILFRNIEN